MNVFHVPSVMIEQVLDEFKSLVLSESGLAEARLDALKEALINLDSLPPLCLPTANCVEERRFAKEVFEYAVILSIHLGDREKFQRFMSCLKPYYTNLSMSVESAVVLASFHENCR